MVARIDAHHEIDFGPVIGDELALAEPMQPLCRPDCRGLCPDCGLRLEDGSHEHDGGEVDPVWPRWPTGNRRPTEPVVARPTPRLYCGVPHPD